MASSPGRRILRTIMVVLATTAALGAVVLTAPASTAQGYGGTGDWPSWAHDLSGSRYQPNEAAITARTAPGLNLKWAYSFPYIPNRTAKSEPSVVGGVAYFGSPDGTFHAVDARTGAARWTFDINTVEPGVGDRYIGTGSTVQGGVVYFGDNRARIYALNAATGALRWSTKLDTHPFAQITGSPTLWNGKIYVGVSSNENSQPQNYACCNFRGQLAALDAASGAVAWRYYTVPPAKPVGTWPSGATMSAPSGGAVWPTPVVDPVTRTVFAGVGNNYTGVGPGFNQSVGDNNSMLALDAMNGTVKWKKKYVPNDVYRSLCSSSTDPGYCPGKSNNSALDWDINATPNLFSINGRPVMGFGSKQGIYRVVDRATGATIWQRALGVAKPLGGDGGIQWGTSYDGKRIYVATYRAQPGMLFALNPNDGSTIWSQPAPANGCSTGGVVAADTNKECQAAFISAPTTSPGVLYEGAVDGKFRAYSSENGRLLWQFDTITPVQGVNGLPGRGSAVSGGGGAVVSNGMVYVLSGYYPFYSTNRGYVLLAFGL